MSDTKDAFDLFIDSVGENNREFVLELNSFLLANDCKCDIKPAKSGYVVSYILCGAKRTLANFVFRKSGVKLRIYADHVAEYQEFLDSLPDKMKKEIKKASPCKRLLNPDDCNPKCAMGYSFVLEGMPYQKCRYMAFMPALNEQNNPYIKQFLEKELSVRNSADLRE